MSGIPAGAMRFNSDSQKLEYWNGSAWFEVHTTTPNMATSGDREPGARGLFAGGYQPGAYQNDIDYINIASTGNTQDFGTLGTAVTAGGGVGSRTRALFGGGYVPGSPGGIAQIDTVVFSSTGDFSDFGDLNNSANTRRATAGNATRGLFAGGGAPGATQIDYVTIATTGEATDLGDLTVGRSRFSGGGSLTRSVFAGGFTGPSPNVYRETIDFVNTSTLGDAQDFGSLTRAKSWTAVCSNATRLLIGGGAIAPDGNTAVSEMEYVTIASGGNGVIFGDLNKVVDTGHYAGSGLASSTRGVFNTGLFLNPNTTYHNVIYFVQISTQGQAQDFGDLDGKRYGVQTASNGHGGL
jgi:hypothetical protein